jgi:hypothetical protein
MAADTDFSADVTIRISMDSVLWLAEVWSDVLVENGGNQASDKGN